MLRGCGSIGCVQQSLTRKVMFTCDFCCRKLDSNRRVQKLIDTLLRTLNHLSLDALVAHGRDISCSIRRAVSNDIFICRYSKFHMQTVKSLSENCPSSLPHESILQLPAVRNYQRTHSNVLIWCFVISFSFFFWERKQWEKWMLMWLEEGDRHQGVAELVVQTINLSSGRWSLEELLSHPQYERLSSLTNTVCHQLCHYQKQKVSCVKPRLYLASFDKWNASLWNLSLWLHSLSIFLLLLYLH